ncbi:hypothetical protein C5Y96_17810 [Blastopirellula marina]|uniref:Uncharacterized protein n=1 Tax=Blastopirellula marina TaxID=124 RepID=A0A2S8F5F5_9BACT|nr:hypothetical protein C5Y96_17810 [Blastopirellula marina]RCS47932.1 hypothetical protein DTL36_17835 [Bremerella cremea]
MDRVSFFLDPIAFDSRDIAAPSSLSNDLTEAINRRSAADNSKMPARARVTAISNIVRYATSFTHATKKIVENQAK